MTEIRGNISAEAHRFTFGNNEKKNISGKINPEYSDFLFVDGKIIKMDKPDEILPSSPLTKFKIKVKQVSKIPEYTIKGLNGDKNANFFEFLQLGKIPYYIGGVALAGCFLAGGKKAIPDAKGKIAGIIFYYLAATAAKAFIDKPVKFFKGIDLNRKYKDIVPLKAESKEGHSGKKTEYHGVYESVDFTRWDLLYDEHNHIASDPKRINAEYVRIARGMGLDKDLSDPDSTVKPYVKKIIVASRAWKSALIIPLAGLAAGLSTYEGWQTWGEKLGKNLKNKKFTDVAKEYIAKPIKESFTHLWSGKSLNGHKYIGKAVILAPIISIIAANLNILRLSHLKEDKFVNSSQPLKSLQLKNKISSASASLLKPLSSTKNNEYVF